MKKKLLFITTLLLLQGQALFSQCISIELSVIWETESHIYYKDSIVHIPKLHITYRNNCNSNYYFLKVSDSKDSLSPPFICTRIFFPSEEKSNCFNIFNYNAKSYTNQNFNVYISSTSSYGNSWTIFTDTIDYTKPHAPDIINCTLKGLYENIRDDKNPDYDLQMFNQGAIRWQFEPSDVLPENIVDSVGNQFVFLKSGEIYTDTYNLLPFQIVEGSYTFFIDQEDIKNYVLYSETIYDKNKPVITLSGEVTVKVVNHELELPEIVGEYHRYSGAFNTNKVTVCFGDK